MKKTVCLFLILLVLFSSSLFAEHIPGPSWYQINDTPDTLGGYGITDALKKDLSNATEAVDLNGAAAFRKAIRLSESEVVDVTDYGAIPDDGIDDYAAFASACAQLSDGSLLKIPQGVFNLSESVHIDNKDNLFIESMGRLVPDGAASEIFRLTGSKNVIGNIRIGQAGGNYGAVSAIALGNLTAANLIIDAEGYTGVATETVYIFSCPKSKININGTVYFFNETGSDIAAAIGFNGITGLVSIDKLDKLIFTGDDLYIPGNLSTDSGISAKDLYLTGGNVTVTDGNISTNQGLTVGLWAQIAGLLYANGGIDTTNISASGQVSVASLTVNGVEILPGGEVNWSDITGAPTNASYTLSGLSEKNFSSLDGKPTNASYTLTGLAEKNYSSLVGTPTNASYTLSGLSEKNYHNLTNKPTSASWMLGGLSERNFSSLTNTPTTLAGYGITDAYGTANAPEMTKYRLILVPETGIPAQLWLSPYAPGSNPSNHYVRLLAPTDEPNAFIIQNGAGIERFRMTPGGNFLIGTSADGGYRLLVNGDAKADSVYTHKIAYPVTESTRFEIESDKLQAFVNNTSAFKVEAGKIETYLPVSQQETTIASATIDRLEVAELIADIPPATAPSVLADSTSSSTLPIAFKHPDYPHDRTLDSGIYSPGYGQLAFWIDSPTAKLPWLRMYSTGGALSENVNSITRPSDAASGITYSGGTLAGGGSIYLGNNSAPYCQIKNGTATLISTYNDYVTIGTAGYEEGYILVVGGNQKVNGALDATGKITAEGGLNVSRPSAPSSPSNGDIYYDSSTHKFRGYADGSWVDLN